MRHRGKTPTEFRTEFTQHWKKQFPAAGHAYKNDRKQVMRGHNIVADGWAGASNPHPHPKPHPPTHKHTIKKYLNARFPTFQLDDHDGPMDGPMDGQTDGRTKPLLELRVRN